MSARRILGAAVKAFVAAIIWLEAIGQPVVTPAKAGFVFLPEHVVINNVAVEPQKASSCLRVCYCRIVENMPQRCIQSIGKYHSATGGEIDSIYGRMSFISNDDYLLPNMGIEISYLRRQICEMPKFSTQFFYYGGGLSVIDKPVSNVRCLFLGEIAADLINEIWIYLDEYISSLQCGECVGAVSRSFSGGTPMSGSLIGSSGSLTGPSNSTPQQIERQKADGDLTAVQPYSFLRRIRHTPLLAQISLIVVLGIVAFELIPIGLDRLRPINRNARPRPITGLCLSFLGFGCFGLIFLLIFLG